MAQILSRKSIGPRVLFLTHRVPFPPDKGDRIRTHHLLKQLAERAKVWLVSLADEPIHDQTRQLLGGLCERVALVPARLRWRWARAIGSAMGGGSLTEGLFNEAKIRTIIRRWAAEVKFDACVTSSSGTAHLLRNLAEDGVPTFLDLMDVDSQKWMDFAGSTRGPKRWIYRFEASRVREVEKDLPGWARGISFVSPAEVATFEQFAGAGTAFFASNGVDLRYYRPEPIENSQTCAFVGAMDYLPNIDGASWFARQIWPYVRSRFPSAEFHIIGRNPTSAVLELERIPGVRVTGAVPDVRPHLAPAAVAVVPLRLARGVQNKVLEALAMGKATIVAPAALAGITAVPGRDLLAATSVSEWVTTVCHLLENPGIREELGRSGRAFVETHHRWETCLEPLVNRIVPLVPTLEKPRENTRAILCS